jgi:hypothetical protein
MQWLGRMVRYDLANVRQARERNGREETASSSQRQIETEGRDRRRAQRKSPRSIKRGCSWQMVYKEININEPGFWTFILGGRP